MILTLLKRIAYGVGRIENLLTLILKAQLATSSSSVNKPDGLPDAARLLAEQVYSPDELMTVDEACRELHIVRTTLNKLRLEGALTTIKKGRSVRLLRAQVLEAKRWYSIPKGKE